jgi:hypothetical protein
MKTIYNLRIKLANLICYIGNKIKKVYSAIYDLADAIYPKTYKNGKLSKKLKK